jgi:hypothetical protein
VGEIIFLCISFWSVNKLQSNCDRSPKLKTRTPALCHQHTGTCVVEANSQKMLSGVSSLVGALWSLPALGQLLLLTVILFITWCPPSPFFFSIKFFFPFFF